MANKHKAVIFGAGLGGKRAFSYMKNRFEILYFIDNDLSKEGKLLCGIPIAGVKKLAQIDFDILFIASMYHEEIFRQLVSIGVPAHYIDTVDPAILCGDEDPPYFIWLLCFIFLSIVSVGLILQVS